nr:hypothetical protein [Dechloromonas sp.]
MAATARLAAAEMTATRIGVSIVKTSKVLAQPMADSEAGILESKVSETFENAKTKSVFLQHSD